MGIPFCWHGRKNKTSWAHMVKDRMGGAVVDAHRLFASTNAASERAKGQPWTVGALRHRLPKAILLGIVHETPTAPAAAAGRAAPHPGSATTAAIAAAAGSSAALSASAPTSASSRGNRGSMLGWRYPSLLPYHDGL